MEDGATRLRIVATAYACEPRRGSEPGIGWNIVRELARRHDVWAITRSNNRAQIEDALARDPVPGLHPVYLDLPRWASWWKRGRKGLLAYYYLWQIGAWWLARRLHARLRFDLAHHVTFGRYWSPALVSLLPVPFVIGPVGGAESAPAAFRAGLGLGGSVYERLRQILRTLGEYDPLVRLTLRRARIAFATTPETALRLRRLGVRDVRCFGNAALSTADLERLAAIELPPAEPVRFISIGRLLSWKGVHLGLRAFARARLPGAEFWVVGDGPARRQLSILAHRLGVSPRVVFVGEIPRDDVVAWLSRCHVLVHPSLHDSGGWVCVEAMAAGRPVLCLDLGGPAVVVSEGSGVLIPATTPEDAVLALSLAMRRLATDRSLLEAWSVEARRRAAALFTWEVKVSELAAAVEALFIRDRDLVLHAESGILQRSNRCTPLNTAPSAAPP